MSGGSWRNRNSMGVVGTMGLLAIGLAIFAGNALAAPEKVNPRKGLVGHWRLDEKKGLIAHDTSGNENHGVLCNHPEWQPDSGAIHGALLLHGGPDHSDSDYVSLPIGSLISQLTDCTIMTWVNWSGDGEWLRIFDFGNSDAVNMFLTPRTGGGSSNPTEVRCMRFAITVDGGINEEQVTAPYELPTDWQYVAVTIHRGEDFAVTLTLYLGGTPVAENGEATLTPDCLGETSNNWLGRSQYSWDGYYAGSLDDFRIYDRALAQDEIQAIMCGN